MSRSGEKLRMPDQPSVVLLIRSLNMGGAQRQLVLLARGLYKGGVDVGVVTFYAGGPLSEELEASGVPHFDLGKRGRWDVIGLCWRFLRLVRERKPSIIYSFLPTANLLGSILKLLPTSPRIIWGIRASNVDLRAYGMLARLEQRVAIWMSRLPDLIICNSESGRIYHRDLGFPAAKMCVVPNGLDTQRFAFEALSRERLRSEWGVSDGTVVIGTVARLDPIKDYENFLAMASTVRRMRSKVVFVCAGGGGEQYARELRQMAEMLGLANSIVWLNERQDAPTVYSALDVFCSASSSEGFPNVIAEAMSCERVCVVTNVGDSKHVVGEAGFVVPPRDAQALAAACLKAIEMPSSRRAEMGRRARLRVEEHFSAGNLVSNTLRVLGMQ